MRFSFLLFLPLFNAQSPCVPSIKPLDMHLSPCTIPSRPLIPYVRSPFENLRSKKEKIIQIDDEEDDEEDIEYVELD